MRIVSLRAENVKRLKAVEITPDGAVVIIGGRNGQGKTSVLDSIEMALAGEKSIPAKPIRTGSAKARIVADLGEIIVKRTFTENGSYLAVENKDGSKPKSPQAILDKLVGILSFDPLGFARMKPPEQQAILKSLTGLDFSDLDAERKDAYEERTAVNRQLKAATAQASAAPFHPSAPKSEVSVRELSEKLQEAQAHNFKGSGLLAEKTTAQRDVERAAAAMVEAEKLLQERTLTLDAAGKRLAEAQRAVSAFKPVDDAALRQQMADAEQTNRQVRENENAKRLRAEEKRLAEKADALTAAIDKADATKVEQMAGAKMPVKGLGLSEDGVTFDGLPFSQCSSAEQLRISMAMGLALNPKLKVLLIRDGSLLDEESLKALAQMAEAADAQIWLERVGDKDKSAVIIEDGSVVGAAEVAAPAADEWGDV